jgi:Reverse transcriptase (RNA-dependent DNA polymerase)
MLIKQVITNCLVTAMDVQMAEDIYGPCLGNIKGKTTRESAEAVRLTMHPLPVDMPHKYKDVVLAVDVMKINQLPFLVTILRDIKFGTVQPLTNLQNKTIVSGLTQVVQVYKNRGLTVQHVLGDGQFDSMQAEIATMGVNLNVAAPGEHVPEVERYIRTIKEQARAVINTLPFKHITMLMLIRLVSYCVLWLNLVHPDMVTLCGMSPRTFVTGLALDYKHHCQLEFGAYAQVSCETDNTMQTRSVGAICLGPTGNQQGGYFFMNLENGRKLTRYIWKALPMPQQVIDQVHKLAKQDYAIDELHFASTGMEAHMDHNDAETNMAEKTSVPAQSEEEDDDDNNEDNDDDNEDDEDDGAPDDAAEMTGVNDLSPDVVQSAANDDKTTGVDTEQTTVTTPAENNHDHPNNIGQAPDDNKTQPATQPMQELRRSTRVSKPPERYIEASMLTTVGTTITLLLEAHPQVMVMPPDQSMDAFYKVLLTQYSVHKGLKVFGEKGAKAVMSELKQIDEMEVLEPTSELTQEEKQWALEYLMFLTEKRCGRIKARGCADGLKQRQYINKEQASSPTVSLEALILTCIIEAREERDVGTCNVPGAFTQCDMDELVHVRFVGKMAEMLEQLNPKLYRKHVLMENGKKVLYAKLKKALYGTLRAALFFWMNLSETLELMGFQINPYDQCVTIVWHLDGLKISHRDPQIVTQIIKMLNKKYGQLKPLTVTRGPKHDYLGMELDYSQKGKVIISMKAYVQKLLDEAPEDMQGTIVSPATEHLFEVKEAARKLDEGKAEFFHYMTPKLLFLCKRGRPDIQTAVAFLCTRVQLPDEHDYKKLARVIRYLRHSKDLVLTLEANQALVVKWYVDASYAMHPDMKGQTGAVMTLGKGAAYSTSQKQKLNTLSSTEPEVVGVSDTIRQVLWTRYFLLEQGYNIEQVPILQDNRSAMLLENNGMRSSGKKTRHIHIQYYFIQDWIAAGEVTVEHCWSEDMVADFMTKPLQGALFQKFRKAILNLQDESSLQECVDETLTLQDTETNEATSSKRPMTSEKAKSSKQP